MISYVRKHLKAETPSVITLVTTEDDGADNDESMIDSSLDNVDERLNPRFLDLWSIIKND